MKKKILFLTSSLTGGGAERVLVNLVNNMNTDEFDITVETMFFNGVNAQFLKPEIRLFCKNAPNFHGVSHIIKRIPDKILYKYFIGNAKYDVIVAFIHGAPAKVVSGCTDDSIKKLVWIHTKEIENGTIVKFYSTKEKTVESYSRFNRIVAVSEDVKAAFAEYSGLGEKITVRYNVNDTEKIKRLAEEPFERNRDTFYISTFGRLAEEKRFDRLINVGRMLKNDGLNFEIHIFGAGAEKEKLESLISETETGDCVFLDGFMDNPYKVFSHSELFVCSSDIEGMSTAMSEAVILGVPVITTDVSGAKEVLGDSNEYGIVTQKNEDDLYRAIKSFITDRKLYEHYKEKVMQRSSFFDTDETVKKVTELFE